MSVLDGPLRAVAKNLARTFGREGTIEYVSTGGYNTTTGTAGQSTTSETVQGAVENYSSREIDGTTVLRGDLKWTIAAKDIDEPRPNDLVDFGEETPDGKRIRWTVVDPHPVYSGEQVALYEVQLRR